MTPGDEVLVWPNNRREERASSWVALENST